MSVAVWVLGDIECSVEPWPPGPSGTTYWQVGPEGLMASGWASSEAEARRCAEAVARVLSGGEP